MGIFLFCLLNLVPPITFLEYTQQQCYDQDQLFCWRECVRLGKDSVENARVAWAWREQWAEMQEAELCSAKMKVYALWSDGKQDSTIWNHMKRGVNEPTTQLKGLMILPDLFSFFILFSPRLFLWI